jgi:hypothetical protein
MDSTLHDDLEANLKYERGVPNRRLRMTVMIGLVGILFLTLMIVPRTAFASDLMNDGNYSKGATMACATTTGGTGEQNANWVNCLPSGRWSNGIGTISTRTEPSKGILAAISSFPEKIMSTAHVVMPNMILTFMQTLWNIALGLNQFAADFTPLDKFGATIDHAISGMINGIMGGSLMAVFFAIGIALLCYRFIHNGWEQARHQMRYLAVSVLCVGLLLAMGAEAAASTEKSPATGSPWWFTQQINHTVNRLGVGLSLDKINDAPDMMSYSGGSGDCRGYLAQMKQQYQKGAKAEESNVVSAIDTIWQETALRSWVTMQWGNPQAGGNTSHQVADNARHAYCHVMDAQVNAPIQTQKDLVNGSMGTAIDDQTAAYLFSTNGFIDPWNTAVNPDGAEKAMDRGTDVYEDRMAVFWETCTAQGGNARARAGWSWMINNLSDKQDDDGKGAIVGNGGAWLRSAPSDQAKDVWPKSVPGGDGGLPAGADGTAANENVSKVCSAVLGNKMFREQSKPGKKGKDLKDTNTGDAAWLGWMFDVPNSGSAWNEAGMSGMNRSDGSKVNVIGAYDTMNMLYGNAKVDTNGAVGSLFGAIVNVLVWGVFALILILSKLMLVLMPIMLVGAVIARALPVDGPWNDAIKNWGTETLNMSLVGTFYGIICQIGVFICRVILMAIQGSSSTFFYQILAGLSPLFAMACISMFCTKILHVGNPLSLRSMIGMVGGGALMHSVARIAGSLMRGRLNYSMFFDHKGFGLGPGGRGKGRNVSSRTAGGRMPGMRSGTGVSDRAALAQSDDGTYAMQGASPYAGAGGGVQTATAGTPVISQRDGASLNETGMDNAVLEAATGQSPEGYLPEDVMVGDTINRQAVGGQQRADRADDAQYTLLGWDADKKWLSERNSHHWVDSGHGWDVGSTYGFFTRHHLAEPFARRLSNGVAHMRDAATAASLPFRRQATRDMVKRGFNTGLKLTAGAGAIALAGTAAGPTAALIAAGVAVHKGRRTFTAYSQAARQINTNRDNFTHNRRLDAYAEENAQHDDMLRRAHEENVRRAEERQRQAQQDAERMAEVRSQANAENLARLAGVNSGHATDPGTGELLRTDNTGNTVSRLSTLPTIEQLRRGKPMEGFMPPSFHPEQVSLTSPAHARVSMNGMPMGRVTEPDAVTGQFPALRRSDANGMLVDPVSGEVAPVSLDEVTTDMPIMPGADTAAIHQDADPHPTMPLN